MADQPVWPDYAGPITLGTDQKIGGPGGTPLTDSVELRDSPTWSGAGAAINLLDSRFGVVGDGVTDDWAAIHTIVEALGSQSNPTGTTIRVPAFNPDGTSRNYRLSKPLHLNRNVELVGEAPWPWYQGPIFQFDAGVHGIIIDSAYQPTYYGGFGNGSHVRNLRIASAPTTCRTVTDCATTAGSATVTSATAAFTSADVGKAFLDDVGTIYPGSTILSVVNATTATLDAPATATAAGLTVHIGGSSGIVLPAHARISDTAVMANGATGFYRGVVIMAAVPYSNANGWFLDHVWVVSAQNHGIYVKGNDSNAGLALGCSVNSCGGDGIHDESFLGNAWTGCQSASNTGSNWWLGGVGSSCASTAIGCYNESGSADNHLDQYCQWLGGTSLGTLDATSTGGVFQASNVAGIGDCFNSGLNGVGYRVDAHPKQPWSHLGGGTSTDGQVFRMGSAVDGHEVDVIYNDLGVGDFTFALDGSGSRKAMQITSALDPNTRTDGEVRFPNGFLLNDGGGITGGYHTFGAAAPTAGTWVQGDFIHNYLPTEQGTTGSKYVVIGWSCVAGGTPGTWVQARCLTGN